MLSNLQVWPPPPSPNLQEMRKRMDERRLEMMQGRKPGTILGFGGLVAMIRRKGHELTIVEHIRPEGDRLIYKHAGRDRVFPY